MWLTDLFGRVKNIDSDIVTNKIKKERLSICESCPNYRNDFKLLFKTKKGVPQCSVCKCAIHSKVMWEGESCPENKWT